MDPARKRCFDPYARMPATCQCCDVDVEGFSDSSKEEIESFEGSFTSWDTGDADTDDARGGPTIDDHDCLSGRGSPLTLLDLPVEIRLQIYSWLHLMCPVQHRELSPAYPSPQLGPRIHKLVRVDKGGKSDDETAAATEADKAGAAAEESRLLLSPWRPVAAVPTALLLANRQIYHEARCVPFHANEFAFVNWFSSGLWSARAFTRNLPSPWQRSALRYARLELKASSDLLQGGAGGGVGLRELETLCDFWSLGLRGLRLKLAAYPTHRLLTAAKRRRAFADHSVSSRTTTILAVSSLAAAAVEEEDEEGRLRKENEEEALALGPVLGERLRRLGALEVLELEMEDYSWDDGLKVRFGRELEVQMNEGRQPHGTRLWVSMVQGVK